MSTSKTIIITLCAVLTVVVILGITALGFYLSYQKSADTFKPAALTAQTDRGDCIHFLSVTDSDAILIESNGKYAMIDCAEDTDNPRGFAGLELKGHEQFVIDYVKKVAGDENGKVTLEFVIGTHSHSDHIGGFDTLINDPDITVKKAYLKRYDESKIIDSEVTQWDNKEVYEQMVDACNKNGVELVQDIDSTPFTLGNLTFTIFNGEERTLDKKVGENENSMGVLIEKDGVRAFLAGDMNNIVGDEDRIGKLVGKVNLLKPGHHGYMQSTSNGFVNALDPDVTIVTNYLNRLNIPSALALIAKGSALYGVIDHNGIIARFDEGKFTLFDNIH